MEIDLPALKEKLWHSMRGDLAKYLPEIQHTDTLMCPVCGRRGAFEDFNVEHVIPRQALDDDPPDVRQAISRNDRAVTTLLCKKKIWTGAKVWNGGCNGWKGSHFDTPLRSIFNAKIVQGKVTTRHQVAFLIVSYLALFAKYGFQVVVTESGVLCRKQFFRPANFNGMPARSQIMLLGGPETEFNEDTKAYWSPPFAITYDAGFCLVSARNTVMYVPVSRNPDVPISFELPFVPPQHTMKADFRPVILG